MKSVHWILQSEIVTLVKEEEWKTGCTGEDIAKDSGETRG